MGKQKYIGMVAWAVVALGAAVASFSAAR